MNGYDQDEYYEDETEDAENECGLNWASGWCALEGTEHCGFWCVFRHVRHADKAIQIVKDDTEELP